MNKEKVKNIKRLKRKLRVRKKIQGTLERPRLSVFRSNAHIYVQVIDDINKVTITSSSDVSIKDKSSKVQKAQKVGEMISKLLKEKNIESIVFDRNGYKYHGRVKALADGIRNGGLNF
jgi:large subunit ribosomal protein L18